MAKFGSCMALASIQDFFRNIPDVPKVDASGLTLCLFHGRRAAVYGVCHLARASEVCTGTAGYACSADIVFP